MTMIISLLVSTSITAGAVVLLLRRIDRRTRPGKMLDELRAEISGVIIELNATTDRNLQLIEDRIEQLKQVSSQADQRIKLLRSEIAKAERGDQLYVQLKKARPPAAKPASAPDTGAAEPQASAADAKSAPGTNPGLQDATASEEESTSPAAAAADAAPAAVTTPATPATPGGAQAGAAGAQPADSQAAEAAEPREQEPMTPQQRLRARVWEMYAMGEKIERIAARVGRTEGEIELMVSLLRKDDA